MADKQPTIDELYSALEKADKAGNSADARELAGWIREMESSSGANNIAVKQDTSGWRVPKLLTNALTSGFSNMLGSAGDVISMIPKGKPGQLQSVAGDSSVLDLFPTSQQFSTATTAAGITNRPEALPQPGAERIMTGAIQGAVPAVLGGGLPALIGGAAGGAAGEAAHEAMPDSGWAPPVAGLAAGLTLGGVAGGLRSFLHGRQAQAALELAEHDYKSASDNLFFGNQKLGADLRNHRSLARRELDAAKAVIQTDYNSALQDVDTNAAAFASQYGASSTLQEAGSMLQSGARNWVTEVLPAKLEQIWSPIDGAIAPKTPTNLTNFTRTLKAINGSAGELEPVGAMLKPRLPNQLSKALDNVMEVRKLSGADDAAFNWGDVRNIRTILGDALSDPAIIKDVGPKNLDKLYAAISEDLKVVARQQGLGAEFDAANLASRELYNRASGPISKIVAGGRASADDMKPEDVAKRLLGQGKQGASDLAVLAEEMPEAIQHLRAVAARDLDGWSRLAPEAKLVLGGSPEHMLTIDELAAQRAAHAATRAERLRAAADNHRSRSEAAAEAAITGKQDNALMVRTTREALAVAKAAVPEKGSKLVNLLHLTNHSLGGVGGGAIGMMANPSTNPFLNAAIGAGVGLGLPLAYKGAKYMVQNPDLLMYPGAGALGGNAANLTTLAPPTLK